MHASAGLRAQRLNTLSVPPGPLSSMACGPRTIIEQTGKVELLVDLALLQSLQCNDCSASQLKARGRSATTDDHTHILHPPISNRIFGALR